MRRLPCTNQMNCRNSCHWPWQEVHFCRCDSNSAFRSFPSSPSRKESNCRRAFLQSKKFTSLADLENALQA